MLAYFNELQDRDKKLIMQRIRPIVRFNNPKFAALFKDIDLSLPKDAPNQMIFAKVTSIGIDRLCKYIWDLAQQRLDKVKLDGI